MQSVASSFLDSASRRGRCERGRSPLGSRSQPDHTRCDPRRLACGPAEKLATVSSCGTIGFMTHSMVQSVLWLAVTESCVPPPASHVSLRGAACASTSRRSSANRWLAHNRESLAPLFGLQRRSCARLNNSSRAARSTGQCSSFAARKSSASILGEYARTNSEVTRADACGATGRQITVDCEPTSGTW